MRQLKWWIGQLLPRTHWTVVERGSKAVQTSQFVIWKMWLGRCYGVVTFAPMAFEHMGK